MPDPFELHLEDRWARSRPASPPAFRLPACPKHMVVLDQLGRCIVCEGLVGPCPWGRPS